MDLGERLSLGRAEMPGPTFCPYSPECVEGKFCELRLYGVLRSSAMHFGVQVSLAYGPTPRDEAGYELTISVVWNPEAFAELPFFQGELEGELD
jgi:hypothetical protein